jgi:hypothetical protein
MRRLGEAGFTVPELIIVMTVTVFMSLLVMNFALDFWGSTSTLENDAETFVSRENSGDQLRDTLNASSSFIDQTSIPDAHTNVPDSGDVSGTHWQLLHAVPKTTAMPTTGSTPILYFQAPSTDSSHNFIMNGVQPYQDEFVLYLDASSKQLMMRTLVNPAVGTDRLKTSCPPAQASASCPADKVMGNEISAVDTRYFSRSGNTIDYTSITDPLTGQYIGPDFPSVEVLELTLHTQRKATIHGATDTSNVTIIRVTSRNG